MIPTSRDRELAAYLPRAFAAVQVDEIGLDDCRIVPTFLGDASAGDLLDSSTVCVAVVSLRLSGHIDSAVGVRRFRSNSPALDRVARKQKPRPRARDWCAGFRGLCRTQLLVDATDTL